MESAWWNDEIYTMESTPWNLHNRTMKSTRWNSHDGMYRGMRITMRGLCKRESMHQIHDLERTRCKGILGKNWHPISLQLLWEVCTGHLPRLALRPRYRPLFFFKAFLTTVINSQGPHCRKDQDDHKVHENHGSTTATRVTTAMSITTAMTSHNDH